MDLFWDTSAFLAVVLNDDQTPLASEAWDQSDADYAWRWLKVEAVSGFARRGASSAQWEDLQEKLGILDFLDLESEDMDRICSANRNWRLRAADAGHLYCFQRAALVVPDLQLVCFDAEMAKVARGLGLRLWQPPGQEPPVPARVRERPAPYGRKKRRAATRVPS